MTYYITAHRADNAPILGNLDGQAAIRVRRPERTKAWAELASFHRAPRVHHWNLEDAGETVLATKLNPNYKE